MLGSLSTKSITETRLLPCFLLAYRCVQKFRLSNCFRNTDTSELNTFTKGINFKGCTRCNLHKMAWPFWHLLAPSVFACSQAVMGRVCVGFMNIAEIASQTIFQFLDDLKIQCPEVQPFSSFEGSFASFLAMHQSVVSCDFRISSQDCTCRLQTRRMSCRSSKSPTGSW